MEDEKRGQSPNKLAQKLALKTSENLPLFQWLEIETRVNKLVTELMKPKLNQMDLNQQAIQKCQDQVLQNKKEILNLSQELESNTKSMERINLCEKKILEFRFESQNSDQIITQQLQSFAKSMGDLKYVQQLNQEDTKNLEKYKETMSTNLNNIREEFLKLSADIGDMTSKLNARLNNQEMNAVTEKEKAQSQNAYNLTVLRDVQNQYKNLEENSKNNIKQQREILTVQGAQLSRLEILEDNMKNVSHNLLHVKKIIYKIDDLQIYIKEMETYIQMYSPLYVQGQIGETLKEVLGSHSNKKLIEYEEKFFSSLNKKFLAAGDEQLKTSKGEALNYIEDLLKNNKNYLINSKYNQPEVDQPSTVVSPTKKQSGSVQIIQNEDTYDEIANLQRSIKNQLQTAQTQFDDKFLRLTERVNYVTEMEQSFQQQIFGLKNSLDDQKTQITNLHQLLQVQMGYHENKKINAQMEIDKLSMTVNKILKYSALMNQLMIQEEIDKNFMSLYGSKEEVSKPISTYFNSQDDRKIKYNFSLDTNCTSCSGQTKVLNQLFKVACLAYHPSLIQVDDKLFRRDEIIEMITKTLQSAKGDAAIPIPKKSAAKEVSDQKNFFNTPKISIQQGNGSFKQWQGSGGSYQQINPTIGRGSLMQTNPTLSPTTLPNLSLKKSGIGSRKRTFSTNNHLLLNASII